MKRILISLFCLWSLNAYSKGELTPQDFASGMPLTPKAPSSVYVVTLPEEVYRGVTRADLGDLRVFNKSGVVIPSYIDRKPPTLSEQYQWITLPVFPIYEGTAQSAERLSLMLKQDSGETSLEVKAEGADSKPKKVIAYLLDASQATDPLQSLTIRPSQPPGAILSVSLEASDDLKSWRPVLQRETLAYLEKNGQSLTKDVLEFSGTKARYFRLSLNDTEKDLGTPQVEAQMNQGQAEAPRQWVQIEGEVTPKGLRYDTKAYFPVDRFDVKLPEANRLFEAQIEVANSDSGSKEIEYNGLLYHLTEGKNEIASGPFHSTPQIPVAKKRLWFLNPKSDETKFEKPLPLLRLGWTPEKLIFVGQGEGPYVLAYGKAGLRSSEVGMDSLLTGPNAKISPQEVSVGKEISLGGPEKLLPPPTPPIEQWKKILTFSLMAGATALLAWMAYRLVKQTA